MEFWLAEGDPEAATKLLGLGIFRGLITNPDVIAATGRRYQSLLTDLAQVADHVFYQIEATDQEKMERQAMDAISIAPGRIHVKIPATRSGLSLIRKLSVKDPMTMATGVPTQTWLTYALAAGAGYISPYAGMVQEIGIATKIDQISGMQRIIDAQAHIANICVGIYDPAEIVTYSLMGVRSSFIWAKDVERFLEQPLVEQAAHKFDKAWKSIYGNTEEANDV